MKPSTFLRAFVFAVIIVGVLPGLALAQGATVADATFVDANWSLTVFPAGNGGSVGASQTTISGNPLRSVNDTVNGTPSVILGTHIYTPFSYNPAVSGPISTVSYSESAICLSGCFGDGQSTGPALLQGGILYIYNVTLVTGPGTTFAPLALTGLAAASFSQVAVTTTGLFNDVHPDFSSNGAPIQFGFFRANGSGPSAGYSLVGGIDNWQVTVTAAAPQPTAAPADIPALGPMAISGLGLLLVLAGIPYLRRRG